MVTTARPPTGGKVVGWPVKRSAGGWLGLAITAALLLVGGGLLGLSLLRLDGTPQLVALALGAAAVGLGAAFAAATVGFFRLSYRFEPDRLIIRGGNQTDSILLEEIEGIYAGQRIGRLRTVPGLTWPGYHVGAVRGRGLGPLRVYCTDRRVESLSVIVMADRSVVLTPEDPPAFRRELIRRIEDAPAEPGAARPAGSAAAWVPHPVVAGLFICALALLTTATLAVQWGFASLPDLIALQADPTGRAVTLSPREEVFSLPLLGSLTLLCNLLITVGLRGRSLPAETLLASSSTLVQAIILLSAIRILPR